MPTFVIKFLHRLFIVSAKVPKGMEGGRGLIYHFNFRKMVASLDF